LELVFFGFQQELSMPFFMTPFLQTVRLGKFYWIPAQATGRINGI